jgi:Arc/MetJ-type ribon-helix-helix transcriptional regulator
VTSAVNDRPHLYRESRYIDRVTTAISVRLDDEALRALCLLQSTGLNRSAAIRAALVAAASRLNDRQSLAAEITALEGDPEDRAEMAAVAELMDQLRG